MVQIPPGFGVEVGWLSVNKQVVPVKCADSRTLDVVICPLEEVQPNMRIFVMTFY